MHSKLLISERFNGDIWRLEIDAINNTIFIEVRDSQDKQVSFAGISLMDGTVLFKDIHLPERWLTGMEAAYDGVLLLHFYQTETGPTHKGLIAIDAQTGETFWSNYAITFDRLCVNGPVVYDSRMQPRKLFLVDPKTGATIRRYQSSVDKDANSYIVLPDLITPGDLTQNLLTVTPFGNTVHYVDYNNFRIVSLHALNGGELNQVLLIFDGEDKVYEDLLNAGIQKMQPEAFIVHKNSLIYIKNKCELKVLPL